MVREHVAPGAGGRRSARPPVVAALVLLLASAGPCAAFSVLAHQGVVDACWEGSIVPALRQRFGNLDAETLERAHAFAYGGSHIADLGYFPFGSSLFTELVHYVRTGDFVRTILADARTPEELGFSYGALAHWVADSVGHPEATNRAVAGIYPALKEQYGDWVTYGDDHGAHIQTEFRFDVYQLTRSRQSPDLFEHAVAFEVSAPLLDRALRETYGLGLDDLFVSTDVAITTYRWGFRELLQEATGIAWALYQGDIRETDPSATKERFVFEMPRADFEQQFGKTFREAGYAAKAFALFTNLVPDVGPFRRLPFKPLPPEAQQQFTEAFRHAVTFLRADVAQGVPDLANLNLDTGAPIRGGEYQPADDAYAELLEKLDAHRFAGIPPDLRRHLVEHFRARDTAHPPDLEDGDVRKERQALARLDAMGG